ncbi:hypothetical protein Micbo1qcDRAFT_156679 [Microdochium bolleyi]|uniref:Uncharacterized protein n=1 Tax=Microdochium bolleyi TaxID=196109 RepID=A0A136JKM2_9PEZI|nr:hypothetical protein Micbo1qcDRAFT_156679 [Microdochium bolleyi]
MSWAPCRPESRQTPCRSPCYRRARRNLEAASPRHQSPPLLPHARGTPRPIVAGAGMLPPSANTRQPVGRRRSGSPARGSPPSAHAARCRRHRYCGCCRGGLHRGQHICTAPWLSRTREVVVLVDWNFPWDSDHESFRLGRAAATRLGLLALKAAARVLLI